MEPDTEAAREALRRDRAAVIARLRSLDDSFTGIVEAARDSNLDDEHDPEGTTIAASRAQVAALITAARCHLDEIDHALERIASGRYGHCDQCGQPIDAARLEARPRATRCLACART